eukprot:7568-Heterococcus_DN1.PRE.2
MYSYYYCCCCRWESHTVKAHEKTEAYLQDMNQLAPDMQPNSVLLREITLAYDVAGKEITPQGGTNSNTSSSSSSSSGGESGCLGTGAYSTVYSAVHRKTGRQVAIKTIHKRYLFTEAERASVDREVLNQRRLCNRHVIRLYETYESEKDLYLVLERAPCGNLDELLFVRRKLSELEAKLVMKQLLHVNGACMALLSAIQLHTASAFTADHVKPANILFSDILPTHEDYCSTSPGGYSSGNDSMTSLNTSALSPPRMQSSPSNVSGLLVKLCDFGHSRKVPDVKYFKYTGDIQRVPHHLFTNTGTDVNRFWRVAVVAFSYYVNLGCHCTAHAACSSAYISVSYTVLICCRCALVSLLGCIAVIAIGYIAPEVLVQESYGKAADMWSAGIMLHKMLSGSLPWIPSRGCLSAPLQLKAKVWSTISAEAQELLHGLLEVDQNLRLTAQEALKHRWFEGIDHCTAMPTSAPSSFRSSSSSSSSFMQQESF